MPVRRGRGGQNFSGGGETVLRGDRAERRVDQRSAVAVEQRERAVVVAADADLGAGLGEMRRQIDHVASAASDVDDIPDAAIAVGDGVAELEFVPVAGGDGGGHREIHR